MEKENKPVIVEVNAYGISWGIPLNMKDKYHGVCSFGICTLHPTTKELLDINPSYKFQDEASDSVDPNDLPYEDNIALEEAKKDWKQNPDGQYRPEIITPARKLFADAHHLPHEYQDGTVLARNEETIQVTCRFSSWYVFIKTPFNRGGDILNKIFDIKE